jgi:hypothetical protein
LLLLLSLLLLLLLLLPQTGALARRHGLAPGLVPHRLTPTVAVRMALGDVPCAHGVVRVLPPPALRARPDVAIAADHSGFRGPGGGGAGGELSRFSFVLCSLPPLLNKPAGGDAADDADASADDDDASAAVHWAVQNIPRAAVGGSADAGAGVAAGVEVVPYSLAGDAQAMLDAGDAATTRGLPWPLGGGTVVHRRLAAVLLSHRFDIDLAPAVADRAAVGLAALIAADDRIRVRGMAFCNAVFVR